MLSTGLLVIRIIVGLTMFGHGTQKLFGWFGGYGLKGTGGWLESIGVKPGVFMAFLAGLSEAAGGILLGVGFLMPVAAALIIIPMLVAIFTVTGKNGYWITANGFEYNFVLIAVAVSLVLTGPGQFVLHG